MPPWGDHRVHTRVLENDAHTVAYGQDSSLRDTEPVRPVAAPLRNVLGGGEPPQGSGCNDVRRKQDLLVAVVGLQDEFVLFQRLNVPRTDGPGQETSTAYMASPCPIRPRRVSEYSRNISLILISRPLFSTAFGTSTPNVERS